MSALLSQAREGDAQARSELLGDLQRYLSFVANKQFDRELQAKMGPSDIVQQSMLQAVDNLDQFRGETVAEFRGWLRKILVNQARQMKRDLHADKRDVEREQRLADSQSRELPGWMADSMPTPGTRAATDEQNDAIQRALSRLSAEDRQIIQWRSWEGLKLEEIAERLGVSVSTASRRWYQALVAFKEQLKHDSFGNQST